MCIRNDQGRFVKAKTMWFDGNPPPKEAEACAYKEGISWLGEIVFVKRQANFVAHSLARASKSYARSQVVNSIPSCIATTLINEII
jgi:hypothetical protein